MERLQLLSHKYRETPEFWRHGSGDLPRPFLSRSFRAKLQKLRSAPGGGGIDSLRVAGLKDENFPGYTHRRLRLP